MRFESITMKNYRQFKNFSLSFLKISDRDLHILNAINGVGKTTFENSVNWCLYNDEPHTSGGSKEDADKNEDKLPLATLDSMDEAVANNEEFVEVSVVICASHDGVEYQFERKANVKAITGITVGRSHFLVTEKSKTGETTFYENEEGNEIVGKFLPKRLRKYFYFDAEDLLTYFNRDRDSLAHIKSSIHEIAQVNVVDKVEDHLRVFIKKYNDEIASLSPDLVKIQNELSQVKERVENTKREIDELSIQIELAEDEIRKADEIINGNEHAIEDNNRINSNNKELERLNREHNSVERDLSLFVREYLILIYLFETNKKTMQYIEDAQRDDKTILDINPDVIKNSIDRCECKVCKQPLSSDRINYLQSIINKLEANEILRALSSIQGDVNRGLKIEQYEQKKITLFQRLEDIEERIKQLETENDSLHARIVSVDVEEVGRADERKIQNTRLLMLNQEKRGEAKNQLKIEKAKFEDIQKRYNEALEATSACKDIKKMLYFVKRAESIVSKVKKEIVDDVKKKLEEQTMELFENLTWKKDFYSHIELDEDFRLRIFEKKHNFSALITMSAGKKQLLAFAFTIALHKVSGYDHLLIIDTPVGRISGENRLRFADALVDVGLEKQVIMSFTDTEFTNELKRIFQPGVISSSTDLIFDTTKYTTGV